MLNRPLCLGPQKARTLQVRDCTVLGALSEAAKSFKATGTNAGAARAQCPPPVQVHQGPTLCAGQLGPGQQPDRAPQGPSLRDMAYTLSTAHGGHPCARSPSSNTARGSGGRCDASLVGPLLRYSQGGVQMHKIAVTGSSKPDLPHPRSQDSRGIYLGSCQNDFSQWGAARTPPEPRPFVSHRRPGRGGGSAFKLVPFEGIKHFSRAVFFAQSSSYRLPPTQGHSHTYVVV